MTKYIKTNYNQTIAYNKIEGKKTGIIFLSGFNSDMTGQKALEIEDWAKKNDHSYLRFDYTGHGKSSGNFDKLVFSDWLRDSSFVIENLTSGPQILIGSSMGGWIMLSLVKKQKYKIQSIIGLASAPDFPKKLIWNNLNYIQKRTLIKNKKITLSKIYDGEKYNYNITYDFIKDALSNLVMNSKIFFKGKVLLYHGMKDEDVPYQTSIDISKNIQGTKNIQVILEKNGEHRLSEKNEIKCIKKLIENCL